MVYLPRARDSCAEYLPFSFPDEINGGVEIRQAPSVSVQSLSRKVFKQLDEYDK